MTEVRSQNEGTLYWVQASGSGNLWATASAPASGTLGYVTNLTHTSARDIQQIFDRGKPKHHKWVQDQAITVQFDLQYGITADYPPVNITASGSTTPMIHMELKMTAPENGASEYFQYHGVALNSLQFTEATPANTQVWQGMALAMNGSTASGYLG